MVLFSCVTEKINQLTKCHYKGSILNCDFPFSPHLQATCQIRLQLVQRRTCGNKKQTLKLSMAINIFGLPHWKHIAYQDKH